MSLTQSQALIRGLQADGWQRHEHVSRKPCWTKALRTQSGAMVPYFLFLGANGTVRGTSTGKVGDSVPMSERRRQELLAKGGYAPMTATQHDPT